MQISIHALREEGDAFIISLGVGPSRISIHALREEGDAATGFPDPEATRISIHALREEGDAYRTDVMLLPCDFYPRPPRGGRLQHGWSRTIPRYFYPRPPRGGQHRTKQHKRSGSRFLSTPSARRATPAQQQTTARQRLFLSTPSARRAT